MSLKHFNQRALCSSRKFRPLVETWSNMPSTLLKQQPLLVSPMHCVLHEMRVFHTQTFTASSRKYTGNAQIHCYNYDRFRFCAAHAEEVGHLCAVTTPQQCQNNHQASRLTCADHSHMEDTWRSHNEKTGWRNWQGAQAPGDVPEVRHRARIQKSRPYSDHAGVKTVETMTINHVFP